MVRAFSLTKGRITQVRNSASPPHRAFFGVGPRDIAVVGRRIAERPELVIAAKDDVLGLHVDAEAEALAFTTERVIIDPADDWRPVRDSVVMCGPLSAPIGRMLLDEDPVIGVRKTEGPWVIVDKTTGDTYTSPMDTAEPRRTIAPTSPGECATDTSSPTWPDCTPSARSMPPTTSPSIHPNCGRPTVTSRSAWP